MKEYIIIYRTHRQGTLNLIEVDEDELLEEMQKQLADKNEIISITQKP